MSGGKFGVESGSVFQVGKMVGKVKKDDAGGLG